jgi:hypothetical protein
MKVHPFDGTLSGRLWSNEVRTYTYVWSVYLPAVVRGF